MDTIELLNVPRLPCLIWVFLQLFHVEHFALTGVPASVARITWGPKKFGADRT
jgi:hypothetical protein